MSKRVFFLIAGLFFYAAIAHAQFSESWVSKPSSREVLTSQPLIVLLKDQDPAQLKKLAKSSKELAEYKAAIADYNILIQEHAAKQWHFSSAVEFRHESELPAFLADKTLRSILQHRYFKLVERSTGSVNNRLSGGFTTAEQASAMELNVVGEGQSRYVWQLLLEPGRVLPSDIFMGMKMLNAYLLGNAGVEPRESMRQSQEKAKRLSSKTLLIDKATVSERLTPEEIKRVYPYAYQFVPRAAIDDAVLNSDTRYACVRLLPASVGEMMHVVFDPADGEILGYSVHSGMRLSKVNLVAKDNFKDFAKAAAGKQ